MQNLESIFGSLGAARYQQLVASNHRIPAWELAALDESGNVLLDLTPYLSKYEGSHSDETVSRQATFALANPGGMFDRYRTGGVSQTLVENRILRMKKGLVDPADGTKYLLPAYWGRIISVRPSYGVTGTTLQVTIGDALKNPVRNKITSHAYENTEVNLIAADILERFGKFTAGWTSFTPISKRYPFVQFPDYGLADALKTLYDPLLFFVRADEAGRIATGPRLGSPLSQASGILGYPDQLTAPSPAAVAHVFPDDPGVESIEAQWQDFDGVYNQVRVLGESTAAQQTLGPVRLLFVQQNSSVAAKDKSKKQYPFSDQGQASPSNAVIAKNAFVEVSYSTSHELDTEPRTAILSLMKWRGAWSANSTYAINEAISYGGSSYACSQPADGTHPPIDPLYWVEIPISGPFQSSVTIKNEDPRTVGVVKLESVTASYLILSIEGRQYSVGNPFPRKYGGFDYNFKIYGQPVLSHSRTLTAYADYNPSIVIGEALSDIFGDHQTYQAAHSPFAMGTPVEVFQDGSSLGQISADGSELSGEANFAVDFEKGRIVLNDVSYRTWAEDLDTAGHHPFSTGGEENPEAVQDFDPSQLPVKTPEDVYKTSRKGDSTFTFPGLQVGQGYDIRLHFADPFYTFEKKRIFSVYAQGSKVIEGLDIVAKTGGAYIAYQETITGVGPDVDGKIVLKITQHDAVSGDLLPECSEDGEGGGGAIGEALICGIEAILPQGQGASPDPVNAGGPALVPTPTSIAANYAFSPVQQTYGAQTLEINDPLIATEAECKLVAGYWVRYSSWKRHPHTFRTASVPHLQPGDLVKWFNPKLGLDFYGYVHEIGRGLTAGAADSDQYSCYVLFAQTR